MKRLFSNFSFRIFLIAFILRLVPVLFSFNMGIGLDDMFQYDMLARSMVAGNGYRWYAQEDLYLIQPVIQLDLSSGDYDPRGVLTSFRPPLYPIFLALIYFVAGTGPRRFFIARLVQVFVSAALVSLTYILAKKILGSSLSSGEQPGGVQGEARSEKAARISAWVVALYPMLVIYPLSLATENLFFLLILCSVLVLLKAAESLTVKHVQKTSSRHPMTDFLRQARWFILAGFLLGLTSLTRSVALAFAGLAVLWVWFFLRDRKMAVVTFIVLVITILPWMVRNSLLNNRPNGIETALGYDLYVSYHPQSSGTFQYPQSLDLMNMLDDAERDDVGIAYARMFITDDPGRVPYLMVRRFGYFFGLERRALTYFYSNDFFGYIPTPALLMIAALLLLPFIAISTSAVLGLTLLRWRKEVWLLALLFIGYITPHIIIIAEDRFHLTLVPFLAILAAVFWTGGLLELKRRANTRRGKVVLGLASMVVILLFCNWGFELWRDADKLSQLLGPFGNQTYFPY